jgi:hypothetical protein
MAQHVSSGLWVAAIVFHRFSFLPFFSSQMLNSGHVKRITPVITLRRRLWLKEFIGEMTEHRDKEEMGSLFPLLLTPPLPTDPIKAMKRTLKPFLLPIS